MTRRDVEALEGSNVEPGGEQRLDEIRVPRHHEVEVGRESLGRPVRQRGERP